MQRSMVCHSWAQACLSIYLNIQRENISVYRDVDSVIDCGLSLVWGDGEYREPFFYSLQCDLGQIASPPMLTATYLTGAHL